jgi:signal transduction histidine kinase
MERASFEHFRIDPIVVFKLGQELITDEIQALLELIKNSYDADATFVAVTIDTYGVPKGALLPSKKSAPGFIEIVDDGSGMDLAQVRDGWLLIARSQKAEMKQHNRQTEGGRTPLGDKGLGRLGAQRLGWGLQLATKTKSSKREIVLAFSWNDFFSAKTLEEVGARIGHRTARRKHGTTVTVAELNEPERWRGEGARELQKSMSRVISPYEGVEGFTISITVDGEQIDLQSVNRKVLETAQLHYDIKFDGKQLKISGRAGLDFFRPQKGDDREAFAHFVDTDEGREFFKRLADSPRASDFGVKKGRGRWFTSFHRTLLLEDVVEGVINSSGDSEIPNPGPFRAEIDSFDLSPGDDSRLEVFGSITPYRSFIKDLAGIRVYRDGFAVRVDRDWLGLGKQWTSARSYYGLKPDTTLGYVALTARKNPQLIEKTDREGFTDTPHYQSLQALMGSFLSFTEEAQSWFRREFSAYLKEKLEEMAEIEEDANSADVSGSIEQTVSDAESAKDKAEEAESEMREVLDGADAAMSAASADSENPEEAAAKMAEAAEALKEALRSGQLAMREVSGLLSRVESVQARNELMHREIVQLEEQLEQGVEAMSLGLTAEALSHEMFNIADGLAARTQALSKELEDGDLDERAMKRFVAHVRGTIGTLRAELGHFAPSMRYVRERRERIDLSVFTEDIVEYYQGRWAEDGIRIRLKNDSSESFVVRMGRGRLTQVFDNLLLNSHYWLSTALGQGRIKRGTITIRLNGSTVVVYDNGPGVDPTAEETLFDPFVTRKPRGIGRGLGLFVARQLLDAEGCALFLGPKRNSDGRRYQFHIDLESARDG